MRLQSLLDVVSAIAEDPSDYMVYLAAPDTVDGDAIDVQLVPVARVEWKPEAKAVRLYPDLPESDGDTLPTLDEVMEYFPKEWEMTPEIDVQLEVPILRPGPGYYHLGFADIQGIVVGPESREMWLLTRPRNEYPVDSFPA
jgi:hypothetical protein